VLDRCEALSFTVECYSRSVVYNGSVRSLHLRHVDRAKIRQTVELFTSTGHFCSFIVPFFDEVRMRSPLKVIFDACHAGFFAKLCSVHQALINQLLTEILIVCVTLLSIQGHDMEVTGN